MVGGKLLQGTILESRPFDLVLRLRDSEESTTIVKHDVKFFFDASRRKHLLKSIKWGSAEELVEADHLRRVGARTDVKARILLKLQESNRAVDWRTAEGDHIRGRLEWFGRFEVKLQTSKGDIFVLRHAVAEVA
jgi:sRNA-binding regulator protein Hfq